MTRSKENRRAKAAKDISDRGPREEQSASVAGKKKSEGSGLSFRPDPSDPAWQEPEVRWAAMALHEWRSLCDQWKQIALFKLFGIGSGNFDRESARTVASIGEALAWKADALSFRTDALRRFSREAQGYSMGLGAPELTHLRNAFEEADDVTSAVRDWVTSQELADQDDAFEKLSDRERECIQALGELGASSRDRRKPARRIAVKAFSESADENAVKGPLSSLVHLGYAKSTCGRKGGSWLTEKGWAAFERLR